MIFDVICEDDRWADMMLQEVSGRTGVALVATLGLRPDHEVALLACNDGRIAALNTAFRGKAQPTNVLSWPAVDLSPRAPGLAPCMPDYTELGDIALSYETCALEAARGGKTLKDHAVHLIVHGVLHLLGYDHETESDAQRMEEIEVKVLEKLGVSNPYEPSVAP